MTRIARIFTHFPEWYGLRREAQGHAAYVRAKAVDFPFAPRAPKAVSSLRSATAVQNRPGLAGLKSGCIRPWKKRAGGWKSRWIKVNQGGKGSATALTCGRRLWISRSRRVRPKRCRRCALPPQSKMAPASPGSNPGVSRYIRPTATLADSLCPGLRYFAPAGRTKRFV